MATECWDESRIDGDRMFRTRVESKGQNVGTDVESSATECLDEKQKLLRSYE